MTSIVKPEGRGARPSEAQLTLVTRLADERGVALPDTARTGPACKRCIEALLRMLKQAGYDDRAASITARMTIGEAQANPKTSMKVAAGEITIGFPSRQAAGGGVMKKGLGKRE